MKPHGWDICDYHRGYWFKSLASIQKQIET